MGNLTDSAAIFGYHRDMMALHGADSSYALGWRDWESQLVRFEALADIAAMDNCSVMDAGCGYGDLLPFLRSRFSGISYTGVEFIPELLDVAARRYADGPGVSFISGNFMTGAAGIVDYVLASGSLNYYSSDPEFIRKAIASLFACCRLGFGFNLLREIVPNGLLAAYDPDEIVAYCGSICGEAKLIRGYSGEDFTVHMYR
jgi:SAM-dependent methyltransferase